MLPQAKNAAKRAASEKNAAIRAAQKRRKKRFTIGEKYLQNFGS